MPLEHYAEAEAIEGIEVIPITHLQQIVNYISQRISFNPHSTLPLPSISVPEHHGSPLEAEDVQLEDFEEIIGQEHVKRAFEIAAAGSHHILNLGYIAKH